MPLLSESELAFLVHFFKERSGYLVQENNLEVIQNRLRPVLEKHKIPTFSNLIEALRQATESTSVKQDCVEAMLIHETMFMRDGKPFEHLIETALPALFQKKKHISIWSASCSSGQEPYSIAMTLEEHRHHFPTLEYKILATDLGNHILERASSGVYTPFEMNRGLPENFKTRYFYEKDGAFHIADSIKKRVIFQNVNLLDIPEIIGMHDIIFCRNTLIYFQQDDKNRVIQNLHKHANTPAYLYLSNTDILDMRPQFVKDEKLHGAYIKP